MKSTNLFYFLILVICIIIISQLISGCKKENENPICIIKNPNYKETIELGEIVNIIVEANDVDGEIVDVSFFINDSCIGIKKDFPYSFNWNTSEEEQGSYNIKVKVTDNSGNSTSDETIIKLVSDNSEDYIIDFEGNKYKTKVYGNQTWMVESLKSKYYANGTTIPLVESTTDWMKLSITGRGMCFFNNDENTLPGGLYTWVTALDGAEPSNENPSGVQGICPDGWHIPSNAEWEELHNYINRIEMDDTMSKKSEDNLFNDLFNNSDRIKKKNMYEVGYRNNYGEFESIQTLTFYWGTTEFNSNYAWFGTLHFYFDDQYRNGYDFKGNGFSVRCIKD
jgi:uncharacterized protein (TIGR02145 family)